MVVHVNNTQLLSVEIVHVNNNNNLMSVQNFSLPSRAGSRTGSRAGSRADSRRDVTPNTSHENGHENHESPETLPRVRSPSPVALRLFRFPSDAAARPRPISTSSSAPALISAAETLGCPNSPRDSLWPHLQVAVVLQPVRESRASAASHERLLLPVHDAAVQPFLPASTSSSSPQPHPPPAPHSISVRCGPRRRRNLSLSEVQAADDAARRRAAALRYRLLFWLLAGVLAANLLSGMAAVGAAAMVAGTHADAPWMSRIMAWLAASLAVAAMAGMALVVLVWQKRQHGDDDGDDGPDKSMELADRTGQDDGTRQEDRNWARFAEDPVRLRRYVETLEERLAGGPARDGRDGRDGRDDRSRRPSSGETAWKRVEPNMPALGLAITTDTMSCGH